jgi:hypothetical protein
VFFSVDFVAAVREVTVQRVGVLQEGCSSQPKKPMNPYSRQYNRDHRDRRNHSDDRDHRDHWTILMYGCSARVWVVAMTIISRTTPMHDYSED